MKKTITAVILALAILTAMLPMQASAAGTEGDRLVLEANGNTLVVKLVLPNAAEEKLSSIQLSLNMDAGTFSEFTFHQEVTGKAQAYEAYYSKERRQVNLYIAGTEPLYTEERDTLTIGSVRVQLNGSPFVNVTGGNVKAVRGTVLEDKGLSDSVNIFPETDRPGTDTGNNNQGNSSGSNSSGNNNPGNNNPGTNLPGNNEPGNDNPQQPSVPTEPEQPEQPDQPEEPSGQTVILQPRLTKVQNVSAGITVKWTKSSNASGYYVYRKTADSSWKRIAAVKGKTKTSYTDKTVKSKNGKTYIYTVKAYHGAKVSKFDKAGLEIYRLTAPVLSKPGSKSAGEISVKWKQNKKASGYQVQYARSADFQKQKATKTVKSGLSRKITGLKQKKTYYVRIRSYKKIGSTVYYSAWSNAKSVKTK